MAGVGSLAALDALASTLRDTVEEEWDLEEVEKKWLRFVTRRAKLRRDVAYRLLQKLQVRVVGGESAIRDWITACIAPLYAPPHPPIVAALETFAQKLPRGRDITRSELELEVLAPFSQQRVAHVPSYVRDRAKYLGALRRALESRPVAHGLFGDIQQVAAVWVETGERLERHVAPRHHNVPTDEAEANGFNLDEAIARDGRHFLVGIVGSGKSERLARLASAAARRAEGDELAPLPLFLSAPRFNAKRDLWQAAAEEHPGLGDALDRLRFDHGVNIDEGVGVDRDT